jgi:hypothetical protein
VVVVAGRNAFDGGWVGSATKAQIPTFAACAWVGVVATAAPKECIPVLGGTPTQAPKECIPALGGTPTRAPKAGKTGGDMVAAKP